LVAVPFYVKCSIAKFTEDIALVRIHMNLWNNYNFPEKILLKGLATLINMVNSDVPLSITPLSKQIPIDPMNKVKKQ
jgi:hypothetical protein